MTDTDEQPAETTSSLLDDIPWVQGIGEGFHAETTSVVWWLRAFPFRWLPFASTIYAGCLPTERVEPVISSSADILWVLKSNVFLKLSSGGVGVTPWEGEEVEKCEECHFDAE